MGRALHQLRLALGRGFDIQPNWSSLCPPYEQESFSMNLPSILHLSLEDTTEDVIVNHLGALGWRRPRHCGLLIQSGSELRVLLAMEHPKSVLDGYAAAGRHALLRYVEDTRILPVAGTPNDMEVTAAGTSTGIGLVLEMSDQEFRRLIRDRDVHQKVVTAESVLRLICDERYLGGETADYELSVKVVTHIAQSGLNNESTKEHFFRPEGDIQKYMNRHWADKSPTYRLWKREGSAGDQEPVSMAHWLTQVQPPHYRLAASNNLNVEQYGMAHNRSYDGKGRPTTPFSEQSRQDFEERLVKAQNSIMMTGARRLGRAAGEDEPATEEVPEMLENIEGYYR